MPNPKRQRLPVPWGDGIERRSGAMVTDAGAFRDLRNVRLSDGRTELRRGHSRLLLLPIGTALLGVFSIRAQGLAAIISYDAVTRTVSLWVVDATGSAAAFVGNLYVLPPDTPSPPMISAAASYDKLVIAHDEPIYRFRQQTMVYAPTEGTISPLLADFAREGTEYPVKFRGVARYLAYIVGWGYGQHNTNPAVEDEDRPEVARISDPGTPTVFQPEHYQIVGLQGDPIVGGDLVAQRFAYFKAAEAYQLVGYDRKTFAVQPLDPQHGLLASRLHVSVSGECFFWSLGGPRVMGAAGSKDLSESLWLDGPSPDALAEIAPKEQAFAYYDAQDDTVHFVFGQWAYVLHLADNLRWTYDKLAVPLLCAGTIHTGGSSLLTPPGGVTPGTASYVDPTYTPGDADPTFYIPWSWSSASPGQRAEVWAKESGGAWVMRANVPVTQGFATIRIPDGKFFDSYEFQVRFTQFGIPAPGYEDPDPSLWPVGSLIALNSVGTPAFFAYGRYHRFSPTEIGFNAGLVRGPGVNQTTPAVYTWAAEYSSDLGATWTSLTLAATPPWNELRLPNALYDQPVQIRLRADRAGGVGGPGPWKLGDSVTPPYVAGTVVLKPEPPSNVVLGGTNNPGGPNDASDCHVVTWGAPLQMAGPISPADGPYDVRIRHYDTMAFIGAWSAIQAVPFAVHSTTACGPGVDPSTSGSRTAEVQVRVNQGSGDVSNWISATSFEP
jgi:hypothetical protein